MLEFFEEKNLSRTVFYFNSKNLISDKGKEGKTITRNQGNSFQSIFFEFLLKRVEPIKNEAKINIL